MEPIFLLDLASRKSAWLAARQAVVAGNVANANTPGFRPKDVTPFQDVLAHTQLQLVSTNAADVDAPDAGGFAAVEAPQEIDRSEIAENGNGVAVEEEMSKAGDISRDYALTTNIARSFHAMLMASLKG